MPVEGQPGRDPSGQDHHRRQKEHGAQLFSALGQPEEGRVRAFLENFEAARSHPDSGDLEAAAAFAARVMRTLWDPEA